MKPLKTLLLIMATLGFTACLNENGSSNKSVNTTSDTETAPLAINPNTPTLYKSLTLTATQTTLNKDDNTTLKLIATASDGTTKELNTGIEYIITPKENAEVNNNTLTAKKDSTLTIQAKAGNTLSNTLILTITWTVNRHTLPPEPDKTLNDATLLGIDLNNNGVRDDVERWIYEEYKDKHPIYIEIAMQAARGYKLVLETPEKAKEIREAVNSAMNCGIYYQYNAKYLHEKILVYERIDTKVFSQYFNTKSRKDTYWQYDKLLSGGVYDALRSAELKAQCDFNTSQYGE